MTSRIYRRSFLEACTIATAGVACPPMLRIIVSDRQPVEDDFFEAVKAGDLDRVRKHLLAEPALLDQKSESGISAYTIAVRRGHQKIGEFLIGKGYQPDLHESAMAGDWERFDQHVGTETPETVKQVNAFHPCGGTAMFAAATGGAGSDLWRVYGVCGQPNRMPQASNATSPLQAALRFRDLATAELTAATLLSNSADPNLAGPGDDPPLIIAAERGSLELIEMLIRLGARVNTKGRDGRSTVQTAADHGQSAVEQLLANAKDIPRTCQTSRSAYTADGSPYRSEPIDDIPMFLRRRFVGQSHRDLDYVRQTLKQDPRLVHSIATTGERAVEAAAHVGQPEIVEHLLDAGAPYSLPTAVMKQDLATAAKLLKEDPDRIEERGPHDFPMLWYPVIGNCPIEMMETLISQGAKIEQQHFLGTTALHWACLRGSIELVDYLIEHGANVNRIGRKFRPAGETPLDLARRGNQKAIAERLLELGAKARDERN